LEGAGAHVFQSSTAADALRVVEEVKLSAVVLDYTRSIKDGHAISRRLAALNVPFENCKALWDSATHMTKTEWSRACQRVQNRLRQLEQR
jgi:hypothetical protein